MIYTYYCTNKKCLHQQDENHSIEGFKEFQPICEKCKRKCEYRFTPSVVHFALKDGPSGSWVSKGLRVKEQRRKSAEAASKRQRDRYGEPKQLKPNVGGNEVGSWREAQSIVAKESGPVAASTYNKRVSKEKLA